MNIDIETKVIMHVEDGYYKQFIIEDNPEAPDISGRVVVKEKLLGNGPWAKIASFTFNNAELPKMIEALKRYESLK